MKQNSIATGFMVIALLVSAAVAFAAGAVSVSIKTEKQEVVVKNGKKLTQIVPATKFAPGDTIVYTITYTNKGTEPAVNAIVDDPVPQGTSYVGDSAIGAGITFSIDGGKTFKKSSELTEGDKRPVSPEMYTNIRWTIPRIQPGGSGKVSFKARVK